MHYELSYIISAVVPETEHQGVQDEVLSYLKKIKAEIIGQPYALGRKKLTYPINKQKHGFYMVLEFDVEDKTQLAELDTVLKHNVNILRHLVIKKPKLSEPKPSSQRTAAKASIPVKPEINKEANKPVIEPKGERVAVDLDDLDKKLDKILEQDQ